MYTYIHTYTYRYAAALCAFGVTRLRPLLADFCYPTFCLSLIMPPPRDPDGNEIVRSPPFVARL